MKEFLCNSLYFGLVLSLLTYLAGLYLKKHFNFFIFNPLLISIALSVMILILFDIDYETYNNGAKYLSYLLTPATVSLAIPLYEQIVTLRKNLLAIAVGVMSGVVTSAFTIFAMSLLFHLDHTEYVTLLPKSITTAIGISLSEELGGYVAITVAAIMITGLFGNIAGGYLCRLFRIKHPVAKGIAIGTASHVMGTAKAMEIGEVEGAMSSLSIAVAGCMTVLTAIIFEGFI